MARVSVLEDLVRPDRYPRAATYDPAWMVENCMGPNPLWLLEDVLRDVHLRPGMRVLDLGCGRGMTSVFLAREFDVDVVAADLWVDADRNQRRFGEAGVDSNVTAVHAEAHTLSFEEQTFDLIVSVDAYHYFGTDDLYVGYITKFLQPDGQLAIAVPGLHKELRDLPAVPVHLRSGIGGEVLSFHTPAWWRFQWDEFGAVEVTSARSQSDGWEDWRLWARVCAEHSPYATVRKGSEASLSMLDIDRGEFLTFALVVGRKSPKEIT